MINGVLDDGTDGTDGDGRASGIPASITAPLTFAVTSVIPMALAAVLIEGARDVGAAYRSLDCAALGAFDGLALRGTLDGLTLGLFAGGLSLADKGRRGIERQR